MNVSFAFSGPCNAGKTTVLEKIHAKFGSRIHGVRECIRSKISTSIDAVRSSPLAYFKLQQQAITEKMRQEDEALATKDGKLILMDRSLADSLFYLTYHVDTRGFTDAQKKEHADFVKFVVDTSKARKRYDIVFMCQPLPIQVRDVMRPQDLAVTQTTEHCLIETLNIGLFTGLSKLTKVDVRTEEGQILQACEEALSELQ